MNIKTDLLNIEGYLKLKQAIKIENISEKEKNILKSYFSEDKNFKYFDQYCIEEENTYNVVIVRLNWENILQKNDIIICPKCKKECIPYKDNIECTIEIDNNGNIIRKIEHNKGDIIVMVCSICHSIIE